MEKGNETEAVEYDLEVLTNKVLPMLKGILEQYPVHSAELYTSSKGDVVEKLREYFVLYDEIHADLTETIINISDMVTEVRDSADFI